MRDTTVSRIRVGKRNYLVIAYALAPSPSPELTSAEQRIVARLVRGDSYRMIAFARGVSTSTIANQAQSIYRKLGVHSREELAARLASPG